MNYNEKIKQCERLLDDALSRDDQAGIDRYTAQLHELKREAEREELEMAQLDIN